MYETTTLPEEFKQELFVEPNGEGSMTQSAIARLVEVRQQAISLLLSNLATSKNLSEPLEQFAGMDLRGTSKIPDYVVGAIVMHYAMYARKKTDKAKKLAVVLIGCSVRTLIQRTLGWQPAQEIKKPLTIEEMFARQAQINLDHARKQELLFDRTNLHGEKLNEIVDEINILKRAYASNTDAVNNYVHNMQQQHDICKAIVASDAPQDYKDRELVKYGILRFSEFSGKSISTSYNTAYTELKLRTGFDVFTKATKKGTQKIDEVEKAGYMKELRLIVNYMLNSLSQSTYGEVTIEDILYNFF